MGHFFFSCSCMLMHYTIFQILIHFEPNVECAINLRQNGFLNLHVVPLGSLNDSRFGSRMKGEGKIAHQIHEMAHLARRRYFNGRTFPKLNMELHEQYKDGQMKLF